ncbi:MAG TPA: hypothetical protein VHO01_10370, partial [Jatrophihabitans sp.]|nr:hypothetical protein [Jatrophihabitans sp.]
GAATGARAQPSGPCCLAGPASTLVQLSAWFDAGGVQRQVGSVRCADPSGLPTASEVYVLAPGGDPAAERLPVLAPDAGVSVLGLEGGTDGFTLRYLRLASGVSPEALQTRTFHLAAGGAGVTGDVPATVATGCSPVQLQASLVQAGKQVLLQVRNVARVACELSGYPGRPAGSHQPPVAGQQVPVLLLQPGDTAAASFQPGPLTGPCAARTGSGVALPSGAVLAGLALPAAVGCDPVVHPFAAGG